MIEYASMIYQYLSESIVAIDQPLYYHSSETYVTRTDVTRSRYINKGSIYYKVPDEFVIKEVLPNLSHYKQIEIPDKVEVYSGNDGQKTISIYWWKKDHHTYWSIEITSQAF